MSRDNVGFLRIMRHVQPQPPRDCSRSKDQVTRTSHYYNSCLWYN